MNLLQNLVLLNKFINRINILRSCSIHLLLRGVVTRCKGDREISNTYIPTLKVCQVLSVNLANYHNSKPVTNKVASHHESFSLVLYYHDPS
jgi:hypothetical protein